MCDWFLTLAKQNSQGESSRHDATECDSLRSDATVHPKGKKLYISSPSLVFARNRAQDFQPHCGYRSDGCQGAHIRLPAAKFPPFVFIEVNDMVYCAAGVSSFAAEFAQAVLRLSQRAL